MAVSAAPQNAIAPAAVRLWISRPWIDLVVGCGGWSAPLLLTAYLVSASQTRPYAGIFYALAIVCNYPHYMATIHRAFSRLDGRSHHRLLVYCATLAIGLIAIAAHLRPELAPWLFTLYVMWSPWHYAGQNFGLSLMFLRRAGLIVSPTERQWFHRAFVASYVVLLAAFNQGPSRERLVRSLGLGESVAQWIEGIAALVFIAGLAIVFVPLRRRATWRLLMPTATLCVTQSLWFVVPVLAGQLSVSATAPLTYSSGLLALMHSAQYLWIAQYTARREMRQLGQRAWTPWWYWALLIGGGIALFVPAPWAASLAGHLDFTSSALIVAAAVNLHHFVLDAFIWKLRDPKVSAVLVGSEAPGQPRPASRSPVVPRRHALALALGAVVLSGLAIVDQVRYFLSAQTGNVAALQTARTINPHDSHVHTQLAAAARRAGELDASEQLLRQAIAANAYDPVPRRLLVRQLVEANRLEDAFESNSALVDLQPTEIDALVNAGVLAQRLGRVDPAAQFWRQALALDGRREELELYLAEMLDTAGRPSEALPHYTRHLELISARTTAPDPRPVALVLVKFADALRRTGQPELASTQYQLAAEIARAKGLNDVETLVVERARLKAPQ